jgi:DMSO/TMAO reductase YedYZ molybdopterin-dependent catalytic subunit
VRKTALIFILSIFLVSLPAALLAKERIKLTPDTPASDIVRMQPDQVDPSLLPVEPIEKINTTGVPPEIDINTWRLEVSGEKVRKPISLSYKDLEAMNMVKKKVLLICPSIFYDYAEWEGVLVSDILKQARVKKNYNRIYFKAADGFRTGLDKEEIRGNLLFLALKVNGVVLPKEHGYPVRLVAEDILGGAWVKWITSIEVN